MRERISEPLKAFRQIVAATTPADWGGTGVLRLANHSLSTAPPGAEPRVGVYSARGTEQQIGTPDAFHYIRWRMENLCPGDELYANIEDAPLGGVFLGYTPVARDRMCAMLSLDADMPQGDHRVLAKKLISSGVPAGEMTYTEPISDEMKQHWKMHNVTLYGQARYDRDVDELIEMYERIHGREFEWE